MSQRHPLALTAGAATLLAATPLAVIFESFTWLFFVAVAIAVVVGIAMLVRTMRGPVWAQVLAMAAGLLLYLTFAFPSGGEIAWLIPTGATFENFNALLADAGSRIRDESVPISDYDGVLLLTTLGVGLVAILVDLAAVGLRKPALAGLPMLAIYSVPVAVLPGGLSVLPFGLAAIGFLWLLVSDSVDRVRRFGRRFTGEGRDVDLWESSPLSSAGRRLGAIGLAVAILVPVAVPGMTSGLIERFGTGLGPPGGRGGSGQGASVNLTAILRDNLIRDEEFVMVRVQTDDPAPYYLRFGVADQATEEGFVNRAPTSGQPVNRDLPERAVSVQSQIRTSLHEAEVEVVDLDLRLAPVYQQVTQIDGLEGGWFYEPLTNQVFTQRGNINGQNYRFQYDRARYTADALRAATVVPPTDGTLRELSNVPEIDEISDIVRGLIDGETTQYDQVKAIYDYFDVGFRYSLTTEPGDSGHPIVDFLDSKQGFCVQYAAAMAWLVREAGYPARVAFGFTRGRGPSQGVYELTNHNLHAWTEVYFGGIGWVPFDATPPSAIPGSAPTSWAQDLPDPVTPGGPENPLPEPGATAPPGGPNDDPRLREDEAGVGGAGPNPTQRNWYLAAAATGLLLLLLLVAPALRRRSLRRRRRARGGELILLGDATGSAPITDVVAEPTAIAMARRDAHAAWAEMVDTMIDYAVPVDESETPRSTAVRLQRLGGLDPVARPPVVLLARAEERARYARHPLRATGLDDATQVFREALAARATRWERLRADLFPPSVVQRWRTAAARTYGSMIAFGGQLRSATAAVNPRRLLTRGAR